MIHGKEMDHIGFISIFSIYNKELISTLQLVWSARILQNDPAYDISLYNET